MRYLNWYTNHGENPEWEINIAIWNPSMMGKSQYLIENYPLYAYDYESALGNREVEEQCINYTPVSIIIPMHTIYHRLESAMIKEVYLNIQLVRRDPQKILRTITFLKCAVVGLKENEDEITFSFNYMFKGDKIRTSQGIHYFDFDYEEYTGMEGVAKNF